MADQTTANGYCTLRSLMRAYWQARKSGKFELKRLNRGLGIAMRKQTWRSNINPNTGTWQFISPGHEKAYQSFAVERCSCTDHKSNKYCKHRIAAMLLQRASDLDYAARQIQGMIEQLPASESTAEVAGVSTPIAVD